MLIAADSFDHYANADLLTKWSNLSYGTGTGDNATKIVAGIGRRSTQGLRLSASGFSGNGSLGVGLVPLSPAPSGNTCIAGMAFQTQESPTHYNTGTAEENSIFRVRYRGTTQVWFRLNQDGTINAYKGSTLLGTSTFTVTEDTYAFWEFKVVIHASAGIVQLRKDGVLDPTLNLSSQNTQNAAVAEWNEIVLGPAKNVTSGGTVTFYYDDFYLLDGVDSGITGMPNNDFLGDVRVDVVYMATEGANTDSTPSTGSDRSDVVDEATANGDTDYNTLASVADKDTFTTAGAPVAGATIFGIQQCTSAKKVDAGTAKNNAITRIGSTDYEDPVENNVGSTYQILRSPQDGKPDGSNLPWADSDFGSAEFGYEKSA